MSTSFSRGLPSFSHPSMTTCATSSYQGDLRAMTASKLSVALRLGRPASVPVLEAAAFLASLVCKYLTSRLT